MNKVIGYFAGMCVLAGCDFLPSVPGIGIVKAHSLVSKYRNLDRVSKFFACIPPLPPSPFQNILKKRIASLEFPVLIYQFHAKNM